MRWDDDADEWVFASGERVYAHNGMLGLSIDGTRIGYGADGSLNWQQMRPDDVRELADAMIERWTKFREALK